jgi:thiol-disulfide isomerase/thioredoxin
MSGNDLRDGGPTASKPAKSGVGRGLKLAIAAVLVLGAATALYVMVGSALKPAGAPTLQSLAKGGMEKLQVVEPKAPPAKAFVDADGKTVRIADLKGQVLVVNLWATWCAPCVKEMPTLAALQKAYEGRPVKVVAISIDGKGETEKAKAFIATHAPLAFYQDASMELPFAYTPPAQGFPTTILYDKSVMERARVSGDADWASPDAKAVIDQLLSEG